jgi:hypothetical protein
MIKPLNVTPLNTSDTLYCECKNCGFKGNIKLENNIVNIDYNGKIESIEDREILCPNCDKIVKEED